MTRRRLLVGLAASVVALLLPLAGCARFPHAVPQGEGKLSASRSGDRYHRLSCGIGNRIEAKNRLYYKSAEDARKDRFTPCQVCQPDRRGRPSAREELDEATAPLPQ